MARRAPRKHSLVEALVALATRDGLGDPVDWPDVRAAILALDADAAGASDLRKILAKVNDPEVILTLEDWFDRAARERDKDADDAARGEGKLLAPLQRVSLAGAAAGGLGAAAGTIGPVIAAPILLATLVVAAAATYGRWRLSKREDDARRDAGSLRRLAEAARMAAEIPR